MKLRSKILMLGAGLLLTGLLASCMTKQDRDVAGELGKAKTACLETGGRWERNGILGALSCTRDYSDGGKSCNRDSDCQALCMAETKTCMKAPQYGCFSHLNDDGKIEDICID